MKRQIRRGVFETNSSSTHSLTMMMKSDYDKWCEGQYYLFVGCHGWDNQEDAPEVNGVYTRDEVIAFLKKNRFYADCDVLDDFDDGDFADIGFCTHYRFFNEYLETFEGEFTTPSGETVVAFGEYGYDG